MKQINTDPLAENTVSQEGERGFRCIGPEYQEGVFELRSLRRGLCLVST